MRKAPCLSAAIAAACILTALTQAQIQTSNATTYKEKVLHAFTGGTTEGKPAHSCVMQKGIFTELPLGGNKVVNADSNSSQKVVESFLNKMPQGNSECYIRSISRTARSLQRI